MPEHPATGNARCNGRKAGSVPLPLKWEGLWRNADRNFRSGRNGVSAPARLDTGPLPYVGRPATFRSGDTRGVEINQNFVRAAIQV